MIFNKIALQPASCMASCCLKINVRKSFQDNRFYKTIRFLILHPNQPI